MADPRILLHPNIPKPLHGISPRTVLGKEWWDIERHKAYENAGFCCEACGTAKTLAAFHPWLEAHEFYEYDYEKGLLKLIRLFALCHACHNFIHNGRMSMMLDRGEMPREKYDAIYKHGFGVIDAVGLHHEWEARHRKPCRVAWGEWRMEIEGMLYGPSSQNITEWQKGVWRNWKPKETDNG